MQSQIHNHAALEPSDSECLIDQAQLAAASYLARYSGRTLDTYRYDLKSFFQWASDCGLNVLDATRPHIELYRASLEGRGLAPGTIDRRLSTVCGPIASPISTVESRRIQPNTFGGPRCTRASVVG